MFSSNSLYRMHIRYQRFDKPGVKKYAAPLIPQHILHGCPSYVAVHMSHYFAGVKVPDEYRRLTSNFWRHISDLRANPNQPGTPLLRPLDPELVVNAVEPEYYI